MTAREFWVLQDDERMQLKEALSLVLMIRYHRVKGQRIRGVASGVTQCGKFSFFLRSFFPRAPRDTNCTTKYICSCGFIVVCHINTHQEQMCQTQLPRGRKLKT